MLAMVALLAGVYLAACVGLFSFQRALIYHPTPEAGAPAESLMTLPRPDAQLRISVRKAAGPQALLYFGGNAEDVAYSLPQLAGLFPDQSLYLMHYRGYGGSTGSPSEEAIAQDALALYDQVRTSHPQVTVIGRSLGSGVALRLASQRPVRQLVLVTPYDSLQEIAAQQFKLFPVRWLLQDKFESWRYAPRITAPTLLIAAEHDEVIPRASTELLLTRFAPGVASLQTVAGTGHNDISAAPRYGELLRAPAKP